jgi:hypothetical protein
MHLVEGKMELLITVCLLIWAGTLMSLCSRRDIEIHSKVTWIVTVLVLNAVGALIYFIFGPSRQPVKEQEQPIDDDAVPVVPEGRSWNPILGENRMPEGEGLNPKTTDHDKDSAR